LLLHHSHTDIGYTHAQPIVWELHRRFIDQAIDCCEATAKWPEPSRMRWTCEVTCTLKHWLDRAAPEQVERFRRLVSSGHLGAGALMFNGTPLSCAEQLARQLHPLGELRERLGLPMKVAIAHDINGVPWPSTQLLLDAGVEMLLMGINAYFGGFPSPRPRAFRWQGADGRELLVWNGSHYSIMSCALVESMTSTRIIDTTDHVAGMLNRYFDHLAATEYPYDFAVMTGTHPHQCDNNPPHPLLADVVRRWNDERRSPLIRFVTPEDVLAKLKSLPPASVPTIRGDWTDYWNFGCASSARETKANRETSRRLIAAEMIRAHTRLNDVDTNQRCREAWWNVNMYDEHTWGASYPLAQTPEAMSESWSAKQHFTYHARSLTGILMRDSLEQLAKNPPHATRSEGVLVVNAAPVPRRVVLKLPKGPDDGSWEHLSCLVHRLDMLCEQGGDETTRYLGPIDLPGNGYRFIPLDHATLQNADDGLACADDFIESPHHRIGFDPATGRITSLLDKQQQWNVIDAASPWPFFGFVRETMDEAKVPITNRKLGPRGAFFTGIADPFVPANFGWHSNWPAIREGTTRLKSARTVRSPGQISLVLEFAAPGVEHLQQRITLFSYRPAIELSASFRKSDFTGPEGIYFAFPLKLADEWKSHFDTADQPLELDHEQLPGVCRDWQTVGQWIAMSDDRRGVTLACPDVPLVQVGGFNYGRHQRSVARPKNPLLLSWVMNNYWPTNFPLSQPGPVRFRYELTTHGPYDVQTSVRAGLEAASPIELHPVIECAEPDGGQFLIVRGEGVVPLSIKLAGDGRGVIVRMINVTEQPVTAQVRLPDRTITSARYCGSLDNDTKPAAVRDGVAHVDLPARGLVAVRLLDAQ
jgi:hypothetical protein